MNSMSSDQPPSNHRPRKLARPGEILQRLGTWLREGWPLWSSLAALGTPLWLAWLTPDPVATLKWSGIALQLLGFYMVIRGLVRLRDELAPENPGFKAAFYAWIARLRAIPFHVDRGPKKLGGGVTNPLETVSGGITNNETTEQRLDRIELIIQTVTSECREQFDSLRADFHELDGRTQQIQTRSEMQNKKAHLGGLVVELVAIWCLAVGVLYSTLPHEFIRMIPDRESASARVDTMIDGATTRQ